MTVCLRPELVVQLLCESQLADGDVGDADLHDLSTPEFRKNDTRVSPVVPWAQFYRYTTENYPVSGKTRRRHPFGEPENFVS